MTDLVSDSSNAHSPKRKFSFRFPHLAHHSVSVDREHLTSIGNQQNKLAANTNKGRNFSEEIKNVPDLQVSYVFN